MRYIRQPKDKPYCGHACVAMIAGKSLPKIVKLAADLTSEYGLGKRRIKELCKRAGIKTGKRWTRIKKFRHIKGTAIILLRHPIGYGSHYTLSHEGRIYDPLGVTSISFKPVSYLEII